MNRFGTLLRLRRRWTAKTGMATGSGVRWSSSSETNPHRQFYKSFGTPLLKVFLGSVFTFQLTYWSWLKLESIETKKVKGDALAEIEDRIKAVVAGSTIDKTG